MEVVIDNCVMMDIFFPHRSRHADAAKLQDILIKKQYRIQFPGHGMFELTSAIRSEKLNQSKLEGNQNITEDNPLTINMIAIDMQFIHKYLIGDMPSLKASDMIYVAIAKKHDIPLITEDIQMFNEAQKLGVKVYKIKDFNLL